MLTVVTFKRDGKRIEEQFDYSKVGLTLHERLISGTKELPSSSWIRQHLLQLIFSSYTSKLQVIIRPAFSVIKLPPVRALVLLDEVLIFASAQQRKMLELFEINLLTGIVDQIKYQDDPNVSQPVDSFYLIALESALRTSKVLFQEELEDISSKLHRLNKQKPTYHVSTLRDLKSKLQKLVNLGDFQLSTFNKVLNEREFLKASQHSIEGQKDKEIDSFIERHIIALDTFLYKVQALNHDVETEESRLKTLNLLKRNYYFQLNVAVEIAAALTSFGVFVTGCFTMMFSVNDQMAAGGTFPNSLPVTAYNQTFISPFFPITALKVAIVFIGGPLLWCFYHVSGTRAFGNWLV